MLMCNIQSNIHIYIQRCTHHTPFFFVYILHTTAVVGVPLRVYAGIQTCQAGAFHKYIKFQFGGVLFAFIYKYIYILYSKSIFGP